MSELLTTDEIKKIEVAIAECEKRTSGEIVPILAMRTVKLPHVMLELFLLFSLLGFFLHVPEMISHQFTSSEWLGDLLVFLLAGLLAFLGQKISCLQRALSDRVLMSEQIHKQAQLEFYEHKMYKTKGGTGILIYLAHFEKQVVVLGGEAIVKKIREQDWQEIVNVIVAGMKQKNLSEALCRGIQMSGELLAQHFPIQKDDENELPNQLIIK